MKNPNPRTLAKSDYQAVPCHGCTICCFRQIVLLEPEDKPERFRTEPHPSLSGRRMLAHKPDGRCHYLGYAGCVIYYDLKPKVCRAFDCRWFARTITQTKARKTRGMLSIWWRGKQLLAAESK